MLGDPQTLAHPRATRAIPVKKKLPAFSPLVLINEGQSIPFFCVHGAGGNVLNFRDIARRLGDDQTFYGLQAPGVDGSRALRTIEEMSELYTTEVLRAHPNGPYFLGGYSGGGVVAYDMAQRLSRDGRDVALLVLLDTFRADVKPLQTSPREHLTRLLDEGPAYLQRRVAARVWREVEEITGKLRMRFYASHGQPLPFDLREFQMTRAFLEASATYRAEPYGGRVILYRASEVDAAFKHVGETLGWDELTPKLEVVQVPGDHDSLVYEPYVNVMTNHLANALREARAAYA
jgi:thioesterase domain-containing protein